MHLYQLNACIMGDRCTCSLEYSEQGSKEDCLLVSDPHYGCSEQGPASEELPGGEIYQAPFWLLIVSLCITVSRLFGTNYG